MMIAASSRSGTTCTTTLTSPTRPPTSRKKRVQQIAFKFLHEPNLKRKRSEHPAPNDLYPEFVRVAQPCPSEIHPIRPITSNPDIVATTHSLHNVHNGTPVDLRHFNSKGELLPHAHPYPYIPPSTAPSSRKQAHYPSSVPRRQPHQKLVWKEITTPGTSKHNPIEIDDCNMDLGSPAHFIERCGGVFDAAQNNISQAATSMDDSVMAKASPVPKIEVEPPSVLPTTEASDTSPPRKCSTLLCDGICASSFARRCTPCIRTAWANRFEPAEAPNATVRLPPTPQSEEKGKRKSVAWADGWTPDDEQCPVKRSGILELPPVKPAIQPQQQPPVLSSLPAVTATLTPPSTPQPKLTIKIAPIRRKAISTPPLERTLPPLHSAERISGRNSDLSQLSSSDDGSVSDSDSDLTVEDPPKVERPRLFIRIPARRPKIDINPYPYPLYQNLLGLVKSFKSQLSGFKTTQAVYSLVRSQSPPAQVKFSGTFSTVSLGLDLFASIEHTRDVIGQMMNTVQEIQLATGLHIDFCPNSTDPKDNITIIPSRAGFGLGKRFQCSHITKVFKQAAVTIPRNDHSCQVEAMNRTMCGELEVIILPDNSHRIYPGQRVIVRFQMTG